MVGLSTSLGLYLGSRKASPSAPPPPFTPSDISSLDLWLNADHNIYGGGSRQFTSANSENLSIFDNPDVSVGDIDFTFATFVRPDSLETRFIFTKWTAEPNREYQLYYDATASKFTFAVSSDGTETGKTLVQSTVAVAGQWYFIVAGHDAVNDQLFISVNDAELITAAHIGGVIDGTAIFRIGVNTTATWNGRIARVFMWKRILTTAEKTWLYNNRNGRLSGEMGVAGTDGANLLTNRVLAYNLNEPSGIAIDSQGNNDLTDNNTVTAADGPGEDIAADSSGNSKHGTLTNFPAGGVAWSSDKPGVLDTDGSLDFDGVNDYVSIPDIAHSLVNFSAFCWVKTTATASKTIFCHHDSASNQRSWLIWLSSVDINKLEVRISADGGGANVKIYYGGTNIADGEWHHIGFTFSANVLKLYVDGLEETTVKPTDATVNALHDSTAQVLIGALNAIPSNHIDALIADCRIYDETVSAANVTALAAGTNYITNLTGQWKLDDGPQTGLVDGDPVLDWRAHAGTHIDKQHLQATYAKRPLFRSAGINSKAAVDFDGTDDLLVNPTAYLTGTQGHVFIVYRLDGVPNLYQGLLGSSDEASTNRYILMCGRGNTANLHVNYLQYNNDTQDALDGSTTINVSTDYIAEFASDGAVITAKVNGAAETLNPDSGANNGDWFDDTSAKDNVTLGSLKNTGELFLLNGKIRHILVFNEKLSDADALLVRQYLADDAGITL